MSNTNTVPRVYITDYLGPPYDVEERIFSGSVKLRGLLAKSENDVIAKARDAEYLMVWHMVEISSKCIDALENLKGIVRVGVGYESIDFKYARKRGILVSNVPDYGVDEVADHSIALILAIVRKIPYLNARVKSGRWAWRDAQPIIRLKGKTLGIIGMGRIGSATALRAKSLGLKIIEYDPYMPPGFDKSLGVESVEFKQLLKKADIITLHPLLSEETRKMIGERELSLMKTGAYLINTSRGGVIDLDALTKSIKDGQIAGAALDVIETEPYPDLKHDIFKLENVIFTPHTAFYSEESWIEMRIKAAQEVLRLVRGKKPRSPVNL